MHDAYADDPMALATIVAIIARRGPSTHHEIEDAYAATSSSRQGRSLRYAVNRLADAGLVEPDPIAGRGRYGHKARRWRLTRPTPPARACERCGTALAADAHHLRRYCSDDCRAIVRRATDAERHRRRYQTDPDFRARHNRERTPRNQRARAAQIPAPERP